MERKVRIQTRWLVSAAGMVIMLAIALWSASSALAGPATGEGARQPAVLTGAGNSAQVAGDSCGVNSNYTVASATGGTVTSGTTRVSNSQCDNCSVDRK